MFPSFLLHLLFLIIFVIYKEELSFLHLKLKKKKQKHLKMDSWIDGFLNLMSYNTFLSLL